jgi:hypothetical protein
MIDPREFEPLPYYSWTERPASVPLTHDEAATAICLARGDLSQAASLASVPGRRPLCLFQPRQTHLQASDSLLRQSADCLALSIETKPGATLSVCRDTQIGDDF